MNKKYSHGTAMIELAIILPLLLIIFFGIVEVGRALYQQHILTKATGNTVRMLARTHQTIDTGNNCTTLSGWSSSLVDAENLLRYGDIDGGEQLLLEGIAVEEITIQEKSLDSFSKSFCTISLKTSAAFIPIISDTLFGFPAFDFEASAEERYIGE